MSGNMVQINSSGQIVLAKAGEGSPGVAGSQALQGAGDPCCCGSSYSGNPCQTTLTSIAIYNYSNTYFTACTDCTAGIAGDCVWDGTFQVFDATNCTFTNGQCFSGANGCYDCTFDGVRMWEFSPPGISSVWYDSSTTTFYMQIICQNGGGSGEIVWEGSKVGGGWSGTYNRTGGCATVPATATIA